MVCTQNYQHTSGSFDGTGFASDSAKLMRGVGVKSILPPPTHTLPPALSSSWVGDSPYT